MLINIYRVYVSNIPGIRDSTCVLTAPHVQVKALCEKAKEILMEESNVQVLHTISSHLTCAVYLLYTRWISL